MKNNGRKSEYSQDETIDKDNTSKQNKECGNKKTGLFDKIKVFKKNPKINSKAVDTAYKIPILAEFVAVSTVKSTNKTYLGIEAGISYTVYLNKPFEMEDDYVIAIDENGNKGLVSKCLLKPKSQDNMNNYSHGPPPRPPPRSHLVNSNVVTNVLPIYNDPIVDSWDAIPRNDKLPLNSYDSFASPPAEKQMNEFNKATNSVSHMPTIQQSNHTQFFVISEYAFDSTEQEDLPFVERDVLEVFDMQGDWYFGYANGKEGIFPSNYVTEIDYDSFISNRDRFICIQSLRKSKDSEISLFVDDIVLVHYENPSGWVYCSLENGYDKGWINKSSLKQFQDPTNTSNKQKKAECIDDYDAMYDDELSFKKGDILIIINMDGDWWTCELNEKIGLVPNTLVEVI